jgi:hypothetical protein
LARHYGHPRLEGACRRALAVAVPLRSTARSYKGLHNILKNKLDQLEAEQPATSSLAAHTNIRGETYYQ